MCRCEQQAGSSINVNEESHPPPLPSQDWSPTRQILYDFTPALATRLATTAARLALPCRRGLGGACAAVAALRRACCCCRPRFACSCCWPLIFVCSSSSSTSRVGSSAEAGSWPEGRGSMQA